MSQPATTTPVPTASTTTTTTVANILAPFAHLADIANILHCRLMAYAASAMLGLSPDEMQAILNMAKHLDRIAGNLKFTRDPQLEGRTELPGDVTTKLWELWGHCKAMVKSQDQLICLMRGEFPKGMESLCQERLGQIVTDQLIVPVGCINAQLINASPKGDQTTADLLNNVTRLAEEAKQTKVVFLDAQKDRANLAYRRTLLVT